MFAVVFDNRCNGKSVLHGLQASRATRQEDARQSAGPTQVYVSGQARTYGWRAKYPSPLFPTCKRNVLLGTIDGRSMTCPTPESTEKLFTQNATKMSGTAGPIKIDTRIIN